MRQTARLAPLRPGDLDEQQRAVYDGITTGPRAAGPALFELTGPDGSLNGPFGPFLLSPAVGGPLQALGAAVRYGAALTPRIRELAILVVAAHWSSDFEWYAHEAVGRHVGITETELRAVRQATPPELTDPAERSAVALVTALVVRQDLDDDEYAAGVAVLGERAIFELTTLVGYYATLALQLRIFRIGAPEEAGSGDAPTG